MKFVDEVVIEVRSGNGGPGSVHFMRQKYMPRMGPDGGDGGRGGHVYFEATHDMQSLLDFQFQPKYEAENGENGGGQDRNGHAGEDLFIRVPVGTLIIDNATGETVCDMLVPGQRVLLLSGGRGGLGNMNFATATRQAPDFAQPGENGEAKTFRLELRLLADAGLVGFPNAGKSTLISRWSAARPKIANYPFTTLTPNLGVVRAQGFDFVLADIPGLIEGASLGKGLGHQFLKHCERTRLLLMLLDLDPNTGRQLDEEYDILKQELAAFSKELANKPMLVALNKADAFGTDVKDPIFEVFLEERGYLKLLKKLKKDGLEEPRIISAVSGLGLEKFKQEAANAIAALGPRAYEAVGPTTLVLGDVELF